MESRADTPEESALARFDPADGARVAGVEFLGEDQAVVQVGFPGKEAYCFSTAHLASDGWYS
jgi:hypothetical protein